MVDTCDFDSLGHVDLVKRYAANHGIKVDLAEYPDQLMPILRRLAERGKALEINTSGLRGPIGETSPTLKYVKRFCELGGEYVTLGSDAHAAEDLGEGIQQAMELASQAGFSYFTFYKKRQPRLLQIY